MQLAPWRRNLGILVATMVCGATILVTGSGCHRAAPVSAEASIPKVSVGRVIPQEVVDSDEYIGRTEASERVEVRARVFGYLKSIEFQDGDFVEEGQKLFTIEPDEYEAIHQQSLSRIALYTAKRDLAKANLARDEKLVKSGSVSREDYEHSLAALAEAEAGIAAAQADANRTAVDLKHTVLYAPISGRIDRVFVSKGNLLTGGQASGTLLTTIVKEQPMYVYFDVDEQSLLRYRRGRSGGNAADSGSLRDKHMPCFVRLADEDDYPHEGELDFASTEVDAGTGTAKLRGVFANKNRELVSGLFVRIRIPVSDPYQALLAPEEALATDQNRKFVYVVGADKKATQRPVTLGARRGTLRIITHGLNPGDQVIVAGLQRVRPGQTVEPELVQPKPDNISEGSTSPVPPDGQVPSEVADDPDSGQEQ